MNEVLDNIKGDARSKFYEHEINENINDLTGEQIQTILHDLRVHQIELELQNEELKKAQEDLVLQRESYYHLFHRAPVGYALLDRNGIIRKANQLLSEILGFSRSDDISEALSKYIVEEDRTVYMSRFRAFFKKPEGKTLELRIKEKNGDILYMEMRGRRELKEHFGFFTEENDDSTILITFNDITERKKAEQVIIRAMTAAEEASNTKSKFLANMSHELRTPLTSVIGFSESLKAGDAGELNEEQRHYLEYIEKSGLHLLKLINELLDISKIESGKMELDLETVDVAMIFLEVENMMYPMAASKNIELTFDLKTPDITMEADNGKLKQIFLNLVSNSLKFTPENGAVNVNAVDFDDRIEFSVADTGIGIPQDQHKSIFEPFEQGGLSTSKGNTETGTGLGLTLVKSFVELHNGKVWLESEPGKGTTFSFYIPVKTI